MICFFNKYKKSVQKHTDFFDNSFFNAVPDKPLATRNKSHNNQLCADLSRLISAYPVVSHFLRFAWQTTAVWVLGLVVIWEICAFIVGATQRTPVNVLPHLYQIIGSFFDTKSITGSGDTIATLVFSSAAETLSRALIGFIIGMVLGYILALLMHLSHIVEKIAFPYLMIIQMIPILGMAPIVLSITGDISSARIIIAAILTFYPVSTNTLAGFKSVGRERHELMRSYGASKFQLYTKMLIPSAMSYFFTGLKISAPMAITASILVDTLQGGNGLGCMLSQSLKGSMTRFVFWDIVIFSAVIGVLSFYLMGVIERAITPAKRKAKKKAQ